MKKYTTKQRQEGSVGMPQSLFLLEFGQKIADAFGEIPYQVGSSLISKKWRDVDIRLILSDEDYEKMDLGDPKYPWHNAKWQSLILAYSALGGKMTGLPIDFQIQQRTYANEKFKGSRNAIFDHRKLTNNT